MDINQSYISCLVIDWLKMCPWMVILPYTIGHRPSYIYQYYMKRSVSLILYIVLWKCIHYSNWNCKGHCCRVSYALCSKCGLLYFWGLHHWACWSVSHQTFMAKFNIIKIHLKRLLWWQMEVFLACKISFVRIQCQYTGIKMIRYELNMGRGPEVMYTERW